MGNAVAQGAIWIAKTFFNGSKVAQIIAQIAIIYGISRLTQPGRPDLPGSEGAFYTTIKQAIAERKRGFGQYRTSEMPYLLYAAKDNMSYDVIALHDGLITEFVQLMLHDNDVELNGSNYVISPNDRTYGSGDDRVRIFTRLGEATETNYPEPTAALPALWPSTARGDGIATLFLECQLPDPEYVSVDYPDGLPIPSAVIKAQAVYDWRLDDTRDGGTGAHRIDDSDTWAWSDNPFLCLAHYLVQDLGYDFERIINPNIAYWSTAANDCDETVTTPDGTEARYKIGGEYYVGNAASAVFEAILGGCGGWMGDDGRGGQIVYAGKWYDPVVTIDDELDIIDSHYVERGGAAEQTYNAWDVSYRNPTERYNAGDAGRWRNETAITKAGGVVYAGRLDFPWVQSPWQAQRCAKIHDAKANSRVKGYIIGGLSLIQCYGEMLVGLNISDCAALDGITVMPTRIEILDLMAGKVKISFVQVTEDAFTIAEEDYVPIDTAQSGGTGSNDVDVPDVSSVDILTTTPYTSATFNLTATYRADVSYQVQHRTDPGLPWSSPIGPFGPVNDGGTADCTVYGLPSSATVYVQFRGYGSFGGGGGPGVTEWGATYGPIDLT